MTELSREYNKLISAFPTSLPPTSDASISTPKRAVACNLSVTFNDVHQFQDAPGQATSPSSDAPSPDDAVTVPKSPQGALSPMEQKLAARVAELESIQRHQHAMISSLVQTLTKQSTEIVDSSAALSGPQHYCGASETASAPVILPGSVGTAPPLSQLKKVDVTDSLLPDPGDVVASKPARDLALDVGLAISEMASPITSPGSGKAAHHVLRSLAKLESVLGGSMMPPDASVGPVQILTTPQAVPDQNQSGSLVQGFPGQQEAAMAEVPSASAVVSSVADMRFGPFVRLFLPVWKMTTGK